MCLNSVFFTVYSFLFKYATSSSDLFPGIHTKSLFGQDLNRFAFSTQLQSPRSYYYSVFLSLSPTQNSTYFRSSLFPVIYMYSSCKINDNTGNKEGCRRMCCKRCGIFAKYCGRAIFGHFDVLNKLLLKVEKKMSGCKRKHSRQDEKV